MQPETHGFAVDVDHLAEITAKEVEVFHVLVDVTLLLHDTVAVFLREDMLDPAGGVDESHHQLNVAAHACRKDDWFALLAQVGQEVIQILALVDVEQALVFLEPQVEVLLPPGRHQVPLLVRREGKRQHLVHLEDHCQFRRVGGRWEQFGLRLVGLQDGLRQISLILGFLGDGFCLLGRFFIEIKQTSCQVNNKSFFNHNLIILIIQTQQNTIGRTPENKPPNICRWAGQRKGNMAMRRQQERGVQYQKQCCGENSCRGSWNLVFLGDHFEEDEGFALVGVLLEHQILSGVVETSFPGSADRPIVHFRVVEGDGDVLLGSVGGPPEALEVEGDLQVVLALVVDLGIDEVQDVLHVANAGPVVLSLDLVEGSVAPFALTAGVDLAVAAGNRQLRVLHRHLVQVVVEELEHEPILQAQLTDPLAYRDVVIRCWRKDCTDKPNFFLDLPLSNFKLKIADLCLFLQNKINDGRLSKLLYLFLNYWRCLLEGKRDSELLVQVAPPIALPATRLFSPFPELDDALVGIDGSVEVAQLDIADVAVEGVPGKLRVGGEDDHDVAKVLGPLGEVDVVPPQDQALVLLEVQSHQLLHQINIIYQPTHQSHTYHPSTPTHDRPPFPLHTSRFPCLKCNYQILKQKDRF